MLIDAGPDYEGSWEEIQTQLAALDASVSDVRAVVLTHGHLDHAGLAWRWQQQGVRVYAGRGEEQALSLDEAARRELRARATATLIEHGVPDSVARRPAARRALTRADAVEGDWPGPLRMTPVQPDRLLDDGDMIEDAGLSLQVLACPGHTPGTIMIWDQGKLERTGLERCYSGDHLLPGMVATAGIQFVGVERWPSMPPYVRSLRSLLPAGAPYPRQRPVDWPPPEDILHDSDKRTRHILQSLNQRSRPALPGHGHLIPDFFGALAWSLRWIERRTGRLRRRIGDTPATAYDFAMLALPHLRPNHIWPVMAETIGLLDLLEERGEVRAARHDGLVTYTATNGAMQEEPANDGGL